MIIPYTNPSLHRPRLNHSRIKLKALLDHTLHGNGGVYSRERIVEEETEGTHNTDIDRYNLELMIDNPPNIGYRYWWKFYSITYARSPGKSRSSGKAKMTKAAQPFYKGPGVVNPPGDIKGLVKEFISSRVLSREHYSQVRIGFVLDALLRLKKLTRKEYADIAAQLAASLWFFIRVYVMEGLELWAWLDHFSLDTWQKPCWLQMQSQRCEVHSMQPKKPFHTWLHMK